MPLEIRAIEASGEDIIRDAFQNLLKALSATEPFMASNEMLPFLKTARDWACFKTVLFGPETPEELIEFKNDLDTILDQFYHKHDAIVVIGDDEDGKA